MELAEDKGERWDAGENGGVGQEGSARRWESTPRLPSGSIFYSDLVLLLAAKAFSRSCEPFFRIPAHLLVCTMRLLVLIPRESSTSKQHRSGSQGTQALSPGLPPLKILEKSVLLLQLIFYHLQPG